MGNRLKQLALVVGILLLSFGQGDCASWWAMHHGTGAAVGVADYQWRDWDESTEAGLDTDQNQDGSDDTFVCFFEGSGNETGRGVLTGSDLVLTEYGNPAAAVGSPPSRDVDGTGDYWGFTNGWANGLFMGEQWTLIVKISLDADGPYVIGMHGRVGVWPYKFPRLFMIVASGADSYKLRGQLTRDTTLFQTTTNAMSPGTVYYLCFWTDGVNNTYLGFTTSKPEKKSDFNANDIVDMGGIGNEFQADDFSYYGRKVCADHNGNNEADGDIYYVVASKKCLIDNDS